MRTSASIFAFSTSNYDAMKKFLVDFGFQVSEGGQLDMLFTTKRGARVRRGDLDFNLEESESGDQKASFSVFLTDFSDDDVERIKSLGYKEYRYDSFADTHLFRTPDGGTFMI
jgi:hypothetical protein